MKIGIFDSGLGGLIITHSLTNQLPDYDYLYLGDTARVPYGSRSQEAIYTFTKQAVDYLFAQNCALIVIACNTASAEALRRIQQEYLPSNYPGKNVIGVLIPAAEAAVALTKSGKIGVLATTSTIASGAFDRELQKLQPTLRITNQAAPLLVPLAENDGLKWAQPILSSYLEPLSGCDTIILGCTHYPYFKASIKELVGDDVNLILQDELLPLKLRDYLMRHPEYTNKLSQGTAPEFHLTDKTDQAVQLAARLYGRPVDIELVSITN
jgi:glutamate racemase